MRTLLLNKEECHRGPLILVNRRYALHGTAQPAAEGVLRAQSLPDEEPEQTDEEPEQTGGELRLAAADEAYPQIRMESRAAMALREGLLELGAVGQIVPVSGYRSRQEQERIYRDSLEENGPEFTRKYVALPDRSEHQTGLAIDLGEGGKELDFIRPSFPEDGVCGRFRQEAARFGFILRYPAGKEEITGIAHEPWHFRYVGCPHSMIMEERGLVLEEYLDFLREQPEGCLRWEREGQRAEVRFIEASKEPLRVPLLEDCLYQVSGDNRSGFILTVWREP